MSCNEDPDREYYPPISPYIFGNLNKTFINENDELTAGLVFIPRVKYIKMSSNFKYFYKIIGMYDHYNNCSKYDEIKIIEECKRTMIEFLKLFTIYIVPINIKKPAQEKNENLFIVGSDEYFDKFSNNKQLNIKTFCKLNEFFKTIDLEVSIFKLKISNKTFDVYTNKQFTGIFSEIYYNNNDISSKFIEDNKNPELYTLLGRKDNIISYYNMITNKTEEINTNIIISTNDYYQDLTFLRQSILGNINIDTHKTYHFIQKQLISQIGNITMNKHLYPDIIISIINNADSTKIKEIIKKLRIYSELDKIINWYLKSLLGKFSN